MELKDRNKSMKDELFRLSQRYSRRMSMVRDHKAISQQDIMYKEKDSKGSGSRRAGQSLTHSQEGRARWALSQPTHGASITFRVLELPVHGKAPLFLFCRQACTPSVFNSRSYSSPCNAACTNAIASRVHLSIRVTPAASPTPPLPPFKDVPVIPTIVFVLRVYLSMLRPLHPLFLLFRNANLSEPYSSIVFRVHILSLLPPSTVLDETTPLPLPLPPQMKVDHTRDMVRLSMLDSVGDSNDDNSSCFGSMSGPGGVAVLEEDGADEAPRTPSGNPMEAGMLSERAVGLGPGEREG